MAFVPGGNRSLCGGRDKTKAKASTQGYSDEKRRASERGAVQFETGIRFDAEENKFRNRSSKSACLWGNGIKK